MKKNNIMDFIPFGQKNAISMPKLAKRKGCGQRTARRLVYNARLNGAVICSTCFGDGSDGYYRPVSAEEALPYVQMQRARIASAIAALKSAEMFIGDTNKGGGYE